MAWCYDPKLSTAAAGKNNAPWWKHYIQTWLTRRRNPNEAIYFREQIEDAAARFRQQVDASRTLVADLTPLDILNAHAGSRFLAELVNKPGRAPWDGATGSGMNWRLATSELEAERRHLRLDGEPVILYSLLSPPARATANLLNDLYRLDSVMTVSLEWRPWDLDAARRKIRGAQRHYFSKRYSMMATYRKPKVPRRRWSIAPPTWNRAAWAMPSWSWKPKVWPTAISRSPLPCTATSRRPNA